MKYILYTLIYIIKDWDLSMEEFKPIGKFLFWVPNFLNNVLRVLFRTSLFPLIWLWFYIYEKHNKLILRFFVYWKESILFFIKKIYWETNE